MWCSEIQTLDLRESATNSCCAVFQCAEDLDIINYWSRIFDKPASSKLYEERLKTYYRIESSFHSGGRRMVKLFSLDSYYAALKTKRLGRPCIYMDQVDSTINEAVKQKDGTLVLAKEQTSGRGQRDNIWMSPPGCAMGSIKLECHKSSPPAKRLCFLQHFLALSAAYTLEKLDSTRLSKDRIRLKWPNDIIYTGNDKPLKIGGILVSTKEIHDMFDITLSFGLNVFNEEPTTCISKIIGSSNGLSIDLVAAEIINNLEACLDELDETKFDSLKSDYKARCIQMNQTVNDETHGQVLVKDVNDEGYLIGEKRGTWETCMITKIA